MSTLWRWVSRILLLLLVCFVALAAIWAYGRWTSPTPTQREALALMQARSPLPEGDNGFELLMALPALPAEGLPPMPVCGDGASCIDVIEAAPEQASAAIEARRSWLEVFARALRAPAFRDVRTDVGVADSLPPYNGLVELRLLRAFDFATGQTNVALEALCEDTAGTLRRASEPDLLIDGMLGVAMFRQQAELIADMRRRAPQDPLPASCAALAIAPDAATEGTLCPALRGEWHWLTRVMGDMQAQAPAEAPRWALPLMHDPEWLLARAAERFAPHCGMAAAEAARADRAVDFGRVDVRWVDHVSRPVSVVLDRIAEPAYTSYAERPLDHVATRRLLAAFLQMDAMDAGLGNAERFAALPAALRDGPRPLRFDADANTLSVALRAAREPNRDAAVLPLPQREVSVADGGAGPDAGP